MSRQTCICARRYALAGFLPLIFIVWSSYFVPLFILNTSASTHAPAAVLTTVRFTAADNVTHTRALEALLLVVSRHFEDVLHVELKEHLHTRGTTTTVPIFLWFGSVKEAYAKKSNLGAK
jgi:hypothetical protein